jgi:hypothetical protein
LDADIIAAVWSTWTGQALGEMVIMESERSGHPKEPVDLTHPDGAAPCPFRRVVVVPAVPFDTLREPTNRPVFVTGIMIYWAHGPLARLGAGMPGCRDAGMHVWA